MKLQISALLLQLVAVVYANVAGCYKDVPSSPGVTCVDTDEFLCHTSNRCIPLNGTCATADCNAVPWGLCCIPGFGLCVQSTAIKCNYVIAGVWLGQNPPTGACCLPGSGCSVISNSECKTQNGTFVGFSTSCSASTCPAQTGACADITPTCSQKTEGECFGVFGGVGSPCGSCCLPRTGACVPSTLNFCTLSKGAFTVGPTCNSCLAVNGSCCGQNSTCQPRGPSDCDLNSWAGPVGCAGACPFKSVNCCVPYHEYLAWAAYRASPARCAAFTGGFEAPPGTTDCGLLVGDCCNVDGCSSDIKGWDCVHAWTVFTPVLPSTSNSGANTNSFATTNGATTSSGATSNGGPSTTDGATTANTGATSSTTTSNGPSNSVPVTNVGTVTSSPNGPGSTSSGTARPSPSTNSVTISPSSAPATISGGTTTSESGPDGRSSGRALHLTFQ